MITPPRANAFRTSGILCGQYYGDVDSPNKWPAMRSFMFSCCWPEQVVEQTTALPVTWNAVIFMDRRSSYHNRNISWNLCNDATFFMEHSSDETSTGQFDNILIACRIQQQVTFVSAWTHPYPKYYLSIHCDPNKCLKGSHRHWLPWCQICNKSVILEVMTDHKEGK